MLVVKHRVFSTKFAYTQKSSILIMKFVYLFSMVILSIATPGCPPDDVNFAIAGDLEA